MPVRLHTKTPGYIAERSVSDSGQVVLYDAKEADLMDDSKERWVVQHYPSNRLAYFTSEKKGRQALILLSQGSDSWNLLSEPVTNVSDGGGQAKGVQPQRNLTEIASDHFTTDDLLKGLWHIAQNAESMHNGEKVIDYKTRADAHWKLLTITIGTPVSRQETIIRKVETRDDVMERALKKPEWKDAYRKILSEIEAAEEKRAN